MVFTENKVIYSKWLVCLIPYIECNWRTELQKNICLYWRWHLLYQLSNIYDLLLLYLPLTTPKSAMLQFIQRNHIMMFSRQGKESIYSGFTNQYQECSQLLQIWVPVHGNILNICRKHWALLSLTPWHYNKTDIE